MAAALAPKSSRIRQHSSNRPSPPDLVLRDSNVAPHASQTLSGSNSFSSINSQPSPSSSHPHYLHQQQQHYGTAQEHDRSTGGGLGLGGTGGTQLQSYSAQYPSYRPYTPTTPTTPTTLHVLTMPTTPTFGGAMGSGYPISPRLDYFPTSSSMSKTSSNAGGLHPHTKSQRASSTRRIPSNESSLYDPYRSRQPGVSANRVKNEYQTQSPTREAHAFPPPPQSYYSGHGSTEDVHEIPSGHSGDSSTDGQAFTLMPPPPVAQRDDHYKHSPTLTASQTLAATYGSLPESPFLPYLPYQPYSSQQPLPSPSIMDAYRSSTAYSSPGLGPIHATAYSIEERSSEHKADPYRSAYSQSVNHNHNHLGASNNSQYQDSGNGSPNPNEDFSSSFESRFSGISQQQQQQHAGQIRYPARDLAGQDSKQALSASFFEMGGLHSKREATSSSEAGVVSSSNKDKPATVVGSFSPKTRQSIAHPSQPSKTDSLETTLQAKTMEEEENDVILQKLGVLSAVSSESRSGGTRSGITYGSGRSRRKGQWTDESEEESHDRGGNGSSGQSRRVRRRGPDGQMMMGGGRRRREAQRRCCCCSARTCMYLTLGLFITFAVVLFFVVPRTPVFVFQSVSSMGPPVVTKDRIREPFSIQLLVDSKSNYVPIRLSALEMIAWLTLDQTKVADNDKLLSSFVIEPRVEQIISIPMMLDYRSARQGMDLNSDPVLQELVEACTFVSPESNLEVPTIRLTIGGKLYIWGLSWIWKPVFTFNANHVPCPVNSRDPILPGTPSPPATLRPIPVPTVTAIMANDSWTASMTMTTPMAAAEAAAASHVVATTSGRWPR